MKLRRHLYILLICLAWSAAAAPQEKPADPGQPGLLRIGEGVYVNLADPNGNTVANSGVVVLEQSVLVFDTHFSPEAGHALAARIRAVSPKPVRYVVLSHYHPDHTHGVQAFPSAHVIGSTAARQGILQRDMPVMNRLIASAQSQVRTLQSQIAAQKDPQEALRKQLRSRQEFVARMSALKLVAPPLTTDDSLLIVEGPRRIRLEYLGAGHTDGDLVLFLPDEKIAFVGDLFSNRALPNTQDASILVWMKTVQELLKLDAEKFIPGHGPVGTREDVKAFLSYLEELKRLAEPAVNRGDSLEQLLNECKVPARFASWQFQNFFPSNVQQMYIELRAEQEAASADKDDRRKPRSEKPKP